MDQITCDHVLFVIASYTAIIREKKYWKLQKKKKRKKRKTKTKKKRRKKAFLATSCLVWLYIAFYFLFLVKITPECLFLFNQFKVGKWTIFSFSRLHVPFIVVQQMWFFLQVTNPKLFYFLFFFIRGERGINQSVASIWYTFVVKTKNNSSYIVFEQTQTRLIFEGRFYLFYGKISKCSKETFLLIFLWI